MIATCAVTTAGQTKRKAGSKNFCGPYEMAAKRHAHIINAFPNHRSPRNNSAEKAAHNDVAITRAMPPIGMTSGGCGGTLNNKAANMMSCKIIKTPSAATRVSVCIIYSQSHNVQNCTLAKSVNICTVRVNPFVENSLGADGPRGKNRRCRL